MLPQQLQRLRNRLAQQHRTSVQDGLARELDEISAVLDAVLAGRADADFRAREKLRRLNEQMTKITSGPEGFCDCCGRPL